MIIVVKVGTSSVTGEGGALDRSAMEKLIREIGEVRGAGNDVVLVSSAAIAAGMDRLGLVERPREFSRLQALSAVGQIQLMTAYEEIARAAGITVGQVLLAPPDFFDRKRYLRARSCIVEQFALGVLPVVNENDAVADDAIRFGDNDRIAALVAHLIHADLLVLLTDIDGVLTADPRVDANASLIEEIVAIDKELEAVAGGSLSRMSQGGMASKLSAAKIATWSGVETVIAAAHRDRVLQEAVGGAAGVGTRILARSERLGARKLWIAFALAAEGVLVCDAGAQRALANHGSSLLPVGITEVRGAFQVGDAVEVCGPDGAPFAKGLAAMSSAELQRAAGSRSGDLALDAKEAVHRDDLVLLPG